MGRCEWRDLVPLSPVPLWHLARPLWARIPPKPHVIGLCFQSHTGRSTQGLSGGPVFWDPYSPPTHPSLPWLGLPSVLFKAVLSQDDLQSAFGSHGASGLPSCPSRLIKCLGAATPAGQCCLSPDPPFLPLVPSPLWLQQSHHPSHHLCCHFMATEKDRPASPVSGHSSLTETSLSYSSPGNSAGLAFGRRLPLGMGCAPAPLLRMCWVPCFPETF